LSLGKWSPRLPTGFLVSGGTQERRHPAPRCDDGTLTLCGRPFQNRSSPAAPAVRGVSRLPLRRLPTPTPHRPAGHSVERVWAAPVSFATTPGMISFPRGTEMFQFPRFPRAGLCVQPAVPTHDRGRVASFGHPRISARWSAPRGLSWTGHALHRPAAPRHPPCALVA
jgi:hypothetical protein